MIWSLVLRGCNLNCLTNLESRELKESLWKHGVVVVRKQQMTAQQLKEFAKQTFGDFMFGGPPKTLDPEISPDLQSQNVYILGNPKESVADAVGKYASQWHHDKDGLPSTEGLDMNALYVVMLYGIQVL